jgi:hypothetical protein
LLRETLKRGLHAENLDSLVRQTSELSQDTSEVLLLYVLKNIFLDISHALEGEPVTVDRFDELTASYPQKIDGFLAGIEIGGEIPKHEIEELTRHHLSVLAVFRSD